MRTVLGTGRIVPMLGGLHWCSGTMKDPTDPSKIYLIGSGIKLRHWTGFRNRGTFFGSLPIPPASAPVGIELPETLRHLGEQGRIAVAPVAGIAHHLVQIRLIA